MADGRAVLGARRTDAAPDPAAPDRPRDGTAAHGSLRHPRHRRGSLPGRPHHRPVRRARTGGRDDRRAPDPPARPAGPCLRGVYGTGPQEHRISALISLSAALFSFRSSLFSGIIRRLMRTLCIPIGNLLPGVIIAALLLIPAACSREPFEQQKPAVGETAPVISVADL